jgi:hypothetical protein
VSGLPEVTLDQQDVHLKARPVSGLERLGLLGGYPGVPPELGEGAVVRSVPELLELVRDVLVA